MPEPTTDVVQTVPARGAPRNARAAATLAAYDRSARLPIVLSALLPLVIAPEPGNPVSVAIGIVSWLVFVVEFVVHERLLRRYLRTHLGKFDLAIVVLTAPWFLLPGTHTAGGFIVVLRLARLARLVVGNRGVRQLFSRLGSVAVLAFSVMVGGAVVAYYAEHPINPEFATFGDSLWPGRGTPRRRTVGGHPDHRRVRRHHAGDTLWPHGRGDDHVHRCRRSRPARRFVGQLLPLTASRIRYRPGAIRAVGAIGAGQRRAPQRNPGWPRTRSPGPAWNRS